MRIAILSDPNNFHTQKWAKALMGAGAEVTVMSYDHYAGTGLRAIRLEPPVGRGGGYSYLDYLRGGETLRRALHEHRIDLLNPLNLTPFGVWARASGFHPTIACAFGADILEYPPRGRRLLAPAGRLWESTDAHPGPWQRWKAAWKRQFFRRQVAAALRHADRVTGDNQWLVDSMRDWFALPDEKVQVLRWGVEPELFTADAALQGSLRARLGIPEGAKLVLSPRGAKPIYQTDIILDGIAEVLAQGRPDAFFLVLGAGYAAAPAIAARAQALQAAHPNFRFVPEALDRTDLHALWTMVDAFISAPVYDGYSAALAEGRYIGAIPIVNDIPAHRELIVHGENGWVCSPFDSGTLAQALHAVLDRCADLKARFAPQNRLWIEQHSIMATNARAFMDLARGITG